MKNKLYIENQYIFIIIIPFILLSLLIIIFKYFKIGSKPIELNLLILIQVLFTIILLNFYKMKIIINSTYIIVSFGIGLIYKKILLSNIDTLKKIKIPWYSGIGIRIFPNGILYCANFGSGIQLNTKQKRIIIGTKNPNELLKLLTTQIHKN